MSIAADQVNEQAGSSYLRTVGPSPPHRPDTIMQNRWFASLVVLLGLVFLIVILARMLRQTHRHRR